MKIVLVVGRKKRGKTTLVERLIPEFIDRGYKVGSIKHTTSDHTFDNPGKDSFRHAQAGAERTLILSPHRMAFFSNRWQSRNVERLLEFLFEGCDLVIGEGFKDSPYPKIEIMDASRDRVPVSGPEDNLRAIVCDQEVKGQVPVFSTRQIAELADFVEKSLLGELGEKGA
ncbi:MAG: molybdopterin-guanine dinucleotide biosynthesis protein B [Candidatus Zixiibacteriota bacterium]|nr:MAG: molybdopterin-guanine dinucleotide biosynthesis protein B [candidate division Zixibacteria bacterium]